MEIKFFILQAKRSYLLEKNEFYNNIANLDPRISVKEHFGLNSVNEHLKS